MPNSGVNFKRYFYIQTTIQEENAVFVGSFEIILYFLLLNNFYDNAEKTTKERMAAYTRRNDLHECEENDVHATIFYQATSAG